jgi:hypothetical protein
MISQRAAVLNKNTLTQISMLIVLRTVGPHDLAALDEWIRLHGTPDERAVLMESLPALPVGTGWVWSPGWPTVEGIFRQVKIAPIETLRQWRHPQSRTEDRATQDTRRRRPERSEAVAGERD